MEERMTRDFWFSPLNKEEGRGNPWALSEPLLVLGRGPRVGVVPPCML